MKILKLTPNKHQEAISKTIAVLESGGLVVFPSDTVYGLLVDAQNPKAVTKLLEFKERKPGQAISVFVANKKIAGKHIIINQNAKNAINNLLPGPFTIVAQSKHQVDPRLEAENSTLGIRIPNYPLILKLVNEFGRPITATSANISSRPPHYSISAFGKSLSERKKNLLNLVIDAGRLPPNRPSTVIDTTTGQLKTLRVGDLLPKTLNTFFSKSEMETKRFAQFLAAKFIKKIPSRAIIFLLEGPLGTGKTIFAKGLGEFLKIEEKITSPTFNICNEYQSPPKRKDCQIPIDSDIKSHYQTESKVNNEKTVKFIHCDLYRLKDEFELRELNFPRMIICGNIYAIEWPEKLTAEMISAFKKQAEIINIRFKHVSENERIIEWGLL
ncbi:MAG TPA: L-threonylcarbamoyladenylate synthase [Clostridia bacterium]|nr:L-threonylcarbamoyladenylate synthase [Clostridia bacterium]